MGHTRIYVPRGEQVQITISVVLASYPQDGDEALHLFALADNRIFQAKRQGRNQVVANNGPAVQLGPPSERSLLERTPW